MGSYYSIYDNCNDTHRSNDIWILKKTIIIPHELAITGAIVSLLIVSVFISSALDRQRLNHVISVGNEYIDAGNYIDAWDMFADVANSNHLILTNTSIHKLNRMRASIWDQYHYQLGCRYESQGLYEEALDEFMQIYRYSDALEHVERCIKKIYFNIDNCY